MVSVSDLNKLWTVRASFVTVLCTYPVQVSLEQHGAICSGPHEDARKIRGVRKLQLETLKQKYEE